jgi:hypothetical protein
MLLIVAAALGGWNYGGFAEDPTSSLPPPRVTPAPPVPPDPPAGRKPPTPSPIVAPRTQRELAPALSAPPIPRPTNGIPPAPTRWRLADSSGQVWEHNDLAGLRRWVAERNAALAYAAAWSDRGRRPATFGGCSSGACYSTR